MIALTIEKTDTFVAKLQRKGINVRWDGWDMIFFNPNPAAIFSIGGRRHNDQWGYETIVSPNEQGQWLVNYRLTRGANG